jgi:broad specificity phosphatase PhoE
LTDNSQYFGEIQGKALSQLAPDAFSRANIERIDALRERGIEWWRNTILKQVARLPEDAESPAYILVVSHGAFIGELVQRLLADRYVGQDPPFLKDEHLLNTAITEIEVDGTTLKGKLLRYGDIDHLLKPVGGQNSDELPF